MGNVLNKQPIVIDTAGATVLFTDTLFIRRIEWVNGTTVGHTAIVRDQNGNTFWEASLPVALQPVAADFSDKRDTARRIDGLVVPTLASGKLYIYLN